MNAKIAEIRDNGASSTQPVGDAGLHPPLEECNTVGCPHHGKSPPGEILGLLRDCARVTEDLAALNTKLIEQIAGYVRPK
jgi:hypothetical protein